MSTLRVNTIQDAAGSGSPAIAGAAKAWVNFNGTGTVAIRRSHNVSSITDNGVGDYRINFTTAMPDETYVAHVTASDGGWGVKTDVDTSSQYFSGSFKARTFSGSGSTNNAVDCNVVNATVFR